MKNEQLISQLTEIINNDGPEPAEYQTLDYLLDQIGKKLNSKDFLESDIADLKQKCSFIDSKESIMGHIRLKPYGYAGDFSIIDRIYSNVASDNYFKWDSYSLANSAAVAVRNRKEYFKSVAAKKLRRGDKLLNIASGPARDLLEFYNSTSLSDIHTTCIEMDSQAIEYSKVLNAAHLDTIDFINKNIFRFATDEKFDVIWSAGLFDYFDDRAFILLLSRFKNWLTPTGEIIIGNFNDDNNPSRHYMEHFGEWYLNHRTEEQLLGLAISAGFQETDIHIGREPENVNLFLHIKPKG